MVGLSHYGEEQMKYIIIFGACGNVGKYMVDYFLDRLNGEYELIGTDIIHDEYIERKVPIIQLNINDRESFKKLPMENVHAVIDLVGPMPARMSGYHPEQYVNTNVLGSFNVFQYAVECHADRILYAKSFSDIIRKAQTDLLLKTDTQPDYSYDSHHSVYTVTQIAATELLKCFHAYYHIKAFIFRLPNIYFWSRNDTYNVNGKLHKIMFRELIDQATEGKTIEVWGDPTRLKDMTYVKDVCQIFYKACFTDRDYGFYNVGTGIGITLLDQIKGIVEVFGEKDVSEIVMRPDKQNAPQYIMDITEAREELGYEPKFSYIEMLKDMKRERELGRY